MFGIEFGGRQGRLNRSARQVQWISPRLALTLDREEFIRRVVDMAKRAPRSDLGRAKKRFSDLLLEYRGQMSRNQLAKKSGLSKSYLTMLELGTCNLPARRSVDKLAEALDLTPFKRRRLLIAGLGLLDEYEPFLPITKGDVSTELAREGLKMVWVIGGVPMEFQKGNQNAVYPALLRAVSDVTTRFTYWIPQAAIPRFNRLREELATDLQRGGVTAGRLLDSLECIVCPELLCLHQFFIYNPLSNTRQGRLGIWDKNAESIIGAIPVDEAHTKYVLERLEPIYEGLRSQRFYDFVEGASQKAKEPVYRARFVKHYPPGTA